ncbi:hypothetical protein M407DRAFT_28333 [Tulasnella calospora MUT 4182]|uniref:Uncharacterized protein n=1 Tax=Tulasnella calospora MUT 4182 TaxID=1051891 RepID=A0A0C3Q1K9_9AGAM|nr:hypothetical protein M407DRAFT_28333 [Tulasnella calospora MUT 4182]
MQQLDGASANLSLRHGALERAQENRHCWHLVEVAGRKMPGIHEGSRKRSDDCLKEGELPVKSTGEAEPSAQMAQPTRHGDFGDVDNDQALSGEEMSEAATDDGSTSDDGPPSEPDLGEATLVEMDTELDDPDEELPLEEADDMAWKWTRRRFGTRTGTRRSPMKNRSAHVFLYVIRVRNP